MRLRDAIASALHLVTILSYFTMALVAFLLPRRADWRFIGVDFLESQPQNFYWIGALLGVFGVLLLFAFYKIGRGRFLQLEMKPHKALIDAKLIEEAIEACFLANFPKHVQHADISITGKERLEVQVELIPLNEKQKIKLMSDMEKKLCDLLRDRFGYKAPFTLFVHSKK